MTTHLSDVLIIGGGAAGLSLALRLADEDVSITLLSKCELTEGSSLYAQGGIAAVLDKEDSFEAHIDDTHTAGAGLCKDAAVRKIVEGAPDAINWLVEKGVQFTLVDGAEYDGPDSDFHLTREGGHSHRRVIHAKDATGREVETTLEQHVRAQKNVTILENHIAIDLITSQKLGRSSTRCYGAYALDIEQNTVKTFGAKAVILSTGGASKAYLYTTNPDTSTGDGIAMAWRAGCRIANMEFVQFHPTCLYHPYAKGSLISEAVRGEGGLLKLPNGERFMQDHHEQAELAPRDIVARAIDYEMKKGGFDSVFLDISHKGADFILDHFPNIAESCTQYGYDMTQQPIPVVPAAHYTCGGILTDLRGRTDLKRLYAVGESSCTGLHGANRLASNSLLECLVIAESAAADIRSLLRKKDKANFPKLPAWDESKVSDPDERIVVSHNWDEMRRFMWDYVGIVRTKKRLQRAKNRIQLLQEEIVEYYGNFRVSNDLIELRNLATVAELTIECALTRKESRGLHYTLDYPNMRPFATDTILTPNNFVSHAPIRDWANS
ncbi:L-aspartate oxidase [Arenicella chitinivorans]|uniref:L-aspartate oxidase n=1 Tax=Arenicella chitinivorans TaxID=1329800 RepID=A0A918VKL2_9GAMM|nr:L-aspartate oxidase [Arenicella chitinivorans]GHA09039.1 L-aspartate oxidase [Arenicella chitinivorans]